MDPNFPPYWAPAIPVFPPPTVMAQPIGKYGISYDFYTRAIQDPLPAGWARHRASFYKEVGRYLTPLGYEHAQYSVWQKVSAASVVWNEMMIMREIHPRGIVASSVRRLQAFRIPVDVMIVTDAIALGGQYSPTPIGPTPRFLTMKPGVITRAMPPGWPGGVGNLPKGTRSNGQYATSLNGANWRRT